MLAREYGIRVHEVDLMLWYDWRGPHRSLADKTGDDPIGNTTWGVLIPILNKIDCDPEVVAPSEEVMTHDVTKWRASKQRDLHRGRPAWGKIAAQTISDANCGF